MIDLNSVLIEILKNFVSIIPSLWPLWILLLLSILIKGFQYWRLVKSGMLEIDKMPGEDFEKRLAILFGNLGYKVQHTGRIGDYGIDLVIEKDGIRTAVQAKCYKRERVGLSAIQQVYAGKNEYGCSEALVVTNSHFTTQAVQLAKVNNVRLWSRRYLIKILLNEK